ncbi:sulfotransferase family protein [Nocardioides mangrovi]|uniref:Sulfotransferase n=1 Tax=Nocardioides mangrovi TaxID=2874580 RepID=A0ABS7UCS6_9ACTN|nr:sulfotransferase [Nocardioides mangrovi]MBZ5738501.1 sulfotransferase [Nocardioides mangrovi]
MSQIFVGGAARSGTTVFATRLGGYLASSVLPEAYFLGPTLLSVATGAPFAGFDPAWRLRTWELSDADFNSVQAAPDVVEAWSRALRAKGVDPLGSWIEHSPHNMRYCATLLRAFPDAHFVHLVRDGRAVGASLRRTDFGPHVSTAVARWWIESVAMGLAAERLFPDRVRLVRFEDFLADSEGVVGGLADAFGLDTSSHTVANPVSPVGSYTRRHHSLVDGEIRPERGSGWQSEVSDAWVRRFERVAGPMLDAFGYELVHPPQESPGQVSRVVDPMIDGVVQLGVKAPRRRLRRWRHAR